jgi:hypothetical protein
MSTPAHLEPDWDLIAGGVLPSLVALELGQDDRLTSSSAVAVGPHAVATTAAIFIDHATWTERGVAVVRKGRETRPGELIGYRQGWDIAVYGCETALPALDVRWSQSVPLGESVAAVGLSAGRLTTTSGIVTARERAVNNARPYERSFVMACAFEPAARDGDAVVDASGRLVGIVVVSPHTGPAVVAPAERARAFVTIGLLIFLVESRRCRDALDHFEQRARATRDWRAFCEAGIVHASLERFGPALDVWREAAAIEPDNPWIHHSIGKALQILGRRQEARDALQKALSLEPEEPLRRG